MKIDCFVINDDGIYPNSLLPLILYTGVFKSDPPEVIESCFATNHWPAHWRSGIFDFHHYHSSAHEALGCFRGRAQLQFGGESGPVLEVDAGDAIVIPAGVAHRCINEWDRFCMVGAYPNGQPVDTKYGRSGERPAADRAIAAVTKPAHDPVAGINGPLTEHWESPNSNADQMTLTR